MAYYLSLDKPPHTGPITEFLGGAIGGLQLRRFSFLVSHLIDRLATQFMPRIVGMELRYRVTLDLRLEELGDDASSTLAVLRDLAVLRAFVRGGGGGGFLVPPSPSPSPEEECYDDKGDNDEGHGNADGGFGTGRKARYAGGGVVRDGCW